MLLDYESIRNMLFLDIETVPEFESYETMLPTQKKLWDKVSKRYLGEDYENASLEKKIACYRKNAGLFPEFARIVAISFGVIKLDIMNPENSTYDVRPLYNAVEKVLLQNFATVLEQAYSKNTNRILAGHNIPAFDIPFLIKRMIKHGIKVPSILVNIVEAKPWEQKVYDTIRVWKFGST
jgi:hypothetical protein